MVAPRFVLFSFPLPGISSISRINAIIIHPGLAAIIYTGPFSVSELFSYGWLSAKSCADDARWTWTQMLADPSSLSPVIHTLPEQPNLLEAICSDRTEMAPHSLHGASDSGEPSASARRICRQLAVEASEAEAGVHAQLVCKVNEPPLPLQRRVLNTGT